MADYRSRLIAQFEHPLEKALVELISDMDRAQDSGATDEEVGEMVARICNKYSVDPRVLAREFNAMPADVLESTARYMNDPRH